MNKSIMRKITGFNVVAPYQDGPIARHRGGIVFALSVLAHLLLNEDKTCTEASCRIV